MEMVSISMPLDAPNGSLILFDVNAPGHCRWSVPSEAGQTITMPPDTCVDPRITTIQEMVEQIKADLLRLKSQKYEGSAHDDPEIASDLPAFLRRQSPGKPLPPINGPTIGDAIQAVNEIETRVMAALETLARRVDDLSAKMDMDPMPFDRDGAKAAIKTLEDWLRSIDNRAAHADQAAATLAAEQEAIRKRLESMGKPEVPTPQPKPEPVQDRKKAGIASIRAAAEAKRNAVIGNSADARDVRQRLVEVALNAGTGHERSIEWLRRLSEVQGGEWNDLRRMLVTEHDVATAAVVETVAIESACVMRIMSASDDEVDGLVAEALERISRVGE